MNVVTSVKGLCASIGARATLHDTNDDKKMPLNRCATRDDRPHRIIDKKARDDGQAMRLDACGRTLATLRAIPHRRREYPKLGNVCPSVSLWRAIVLRR